MAKTALPQPELPTEPMRKSPKKPADPEALLKRMAGLCARSEQCTFDIATKLYKAGLSRDKREEIIEYLTANRYLDDARFARSFASYKVRFSAWGKRKIRMALAAKRISSDLIADALDAIDETDYAAALSRVIEAKKKDMDLTDREQRAKLYRSLLSRGFESDIISKSLSSL